MDVKNYHRFLNLKNNAYIVNKNIILFCILTKCFITHNNNLKLKINYLLKKIQFLFIIFCRKFLAKDKPKWEYEFNSFSRKMRIKLRIWEFNWGLE